MSETNPRAKLLGDLIRQARQHAERTVEACAQVLGITSEQYEQAEQGENAISLPDLEVLALYLKVPMGYFWGSEALHEKAHVDYVNLVALRHRVIGVLLRQLRIREKRSLEDLAAELDIPLARVEAYESGDMPIPYLHLELLSRSFGISVNHFLETDRGPMGRHEKEMALIKQFRALSPELQSFMVNSQNGAYLDTAQRLSMMDVKQLRQIAESILEITW